MLARRGRRSEVGGQGALLPLVLSAAREAESRIAETVRRHKTAKREAVDMIERAQRHVGKTGNGRIGQDNCAQRSAMRQPRPPAALRQSRPQAPGRVPLMAQAAARAETARAETAAD